MKFRIQKLISYAEQKRIGKTFGMRVGGVRNLDEALEQLF
jgi:hypothetical protein